MSVKTKKSQAPRFIGVVQAEFLNDGRLMKLLADFGYQGSDFKYWRVPKHTVVDGASIPRVLWTFIGSPFVGRYRNASVVHDYFCDVKSESWQAVHYMFYEACLVGGVDLILAKVLYAGVYAGGPRWAAKPETGLKAILKARSTTYFPESAIHVSEPSKFKRMLQWIENNDPDLTQIETYIHKSL